MLTGNKRFTVDADAFRRTAAGYGFPEPGSAQLSRLQTAAAYAGIAYEAGEAGEDLRHALPIFERLPGAKRYTINLDAIRATVGDHQLEFTISDEGKPFDPTAAPEADTEAGLAQRRIGGLGIHLVRQIMDNVRYEWKDGRNVLNLIKNI